MDICLAEAVSLCFVFGHRVQIYLLTYLLTYHLDLFIWTTFTTSSIPKIVYPFFHTTYSYNPETWKSLRSAFSRPHTSAKCKATVTQWFWIQFRPLPKVKYVFLVVKAKFDCIHPQLLGMSCFNIKKSRREPWFSGSRIRIMIQITLERSAVLAVPYVISAEQFHPSQLFLLSHIRTKNDFT